MSSNRAASWSHTGHALASTDITTTELPSPIVEHFDTTDIEESASKASHSPVDDMALYLQQLNLLEESVHTVNSEPSPTASSPTSGDGRSGEPSSTATSMVDPKYSPFTDSRILPGLHYFKIIDVRFEQFCEHYLPKCKEVCQIRSLSAQLLTSCLV